MSLDLSNRKLKEIPYIDPKLGIHTLDLSGNEISMITNLPVGLIYLNLANNKIKKVENLTEKIEYLYIYENQIKKLPNNLLKLLNLKEINYYGNPISKVNNRLLNKFNKLHRHNLKINLF